MIALAALAAGGPAVGAWSGCNGVSGGGRSQDPIVVTLVDPAAGDTAELDVGMPLEVTFKADAKGTYRVWLQKGNEADQVVTLARGEIEADRSETIQVDCLDLSSRDSRLLVAVTDGIRPPGEASATLSRTGRSPAVLAVTPDKGTGGDTITLRGGGFTADPLPLVRVGDALASDVTLVSACELRATVPDRDRLGPVDVSVDFRDGQPEQVLVEAFRFIGEKPLALTGVDRPTGSVAGGYELELQGESFEEGMEITFNGVAVPTPDPPPTPTRVKVLVPAGMPGPATITLKTPDAQVSRDDLFTYVDAEITDIMPDHVPYNMSKTVTVEGRNLNGATAIIFGQNPAIPVTGADDAGFTVQSPALSVEVGPVPVTVKTSDFGDITTADGIRFDGPTPVLTMLSRTRGSSAGGEMVTVTGNGFFLNTQVTFGDVPAMIVDASRASQGTLVVKTPAHDPGRVDVRVVNVDGKKSGSQAFTFVVPPEIVAICPRHGTAGAPFEVDGLNFAANAVLVVAGDIVAAVVAPPEVITADAPPDLTAPADVVVTNPDDGLSAALRNGLRVGELQNLQVTRFQRTGNACQYTISGSGFESGMTVRFNDDGTTLDTPTVSDDATQLNGSVDRALCTGGASQVVVCFAPESCSNLPDPAQVCSPSLNLP